MDKECVALQWKGRMNPKIKSYTDERKNMHEMMCWEQGKTLWRKDFLEICKEGKITVKRCTYYKLSIGSLLDVRPPLALHYYYRIYS